jgi:hypothetical protein
MLPGVKKPEAEKQAQLDRVLAAHRAGRSGADIAREEGCSTRWVRELLRQARAAERGDPQRRPPVVLEVPDAMSLDPLAAVMRSIAVTDHVERELLTLAGSSRNDPVRVGALKGAAQMAMDRLGLLERLGVLPEFGRRWWTDEVQMGAAWKALAKLAKDAGLDIEELQREFEELLNRPGPERQLSVVGLAPEAPAGAVAA